MWGPQGRARLTESGQVALPIEWDTYISAVLSVITAVLLYALQILRKLISMHTGNLMYSSLDLSHLPRVMRTPSRITSVTMGLVLAFLAVRLAIAPAIRATFQVASLEVRTVSRRGLIPPNSDVVRLDHVRSELDEWLLDNVANGTVVTSNTPYSYRVVANLTQTDVSDRSPYGAHFGNAQYGNFTIWNRAEDEQFILVAIGSSAPGVSRPGCSSEDFVLTGTGSFVRPTWPENYTLVVHFMSAMVSCYRPDRHLLWPNNTSSNTTALQPCYISEDRRLYGYDVNGTTVFALPYTGQATTENIGELLLRVEVLAGTPAWYNPLAACGVDESLAWTAGSHAAQTPLHNSSFGFSTLLYYDATARGFLDYKGQASILMPINYFNSSRVVTNPAAASRAPGNSRSWLPPGSTVVSGSTGILQFMLSAMLNDDAELQAHISGTFWILTPATYALLLLFVLPIPVLLAVKWFGKEVILYEDVYSLAVSSTQQVGVERCQSAFGQSTLRLRKGSLNALYLRVDPDTMQLHFTASEQEAYTLHVRKALCNPGTTSAAAAGGAGGKGDETMSRNDGDEDSPVLDQTKMLTNHGLFHMQHVG